MKYIIDSLQTIKNSQTLALANETGKYFFTDSTLKESKAYYKTADKEYLYSTTIEKMNTARNVIVSNVKRVEFTKGEINKYWVEIHKKYSLLQHALFFVLIGAPLGVMTRKGGFGMAAKHQLIFLFNLLGISYRW
ncbi:MAG: LptF/LptG family permease [Ignavibacteriales bacterium]|nr:LptF/LptG family permease [Ignavibacteriales bacterium]